MDVGGREDMTTVETTSVPPPLQLDFSTDASPQIQHMGVVLVIIYQSECLITSFTRTEVMSVIHQI